MTGALFVTAAGLGTVTLILKSASLRQWLYGPHLTAFGTYRHELHGSYGGGARRASSLIRHDANAHIQK